MKSHVSWSVFSDFWCPQCIVTCLTNSNQQLLGEGQNASCASFCYSLDLNHMFKPDRVKAMFNSLVCGEDEEIRETAANQAEYQHAILAFRGLPSRICMAAQFISERAGDARRAPVLSSIIEFLAQHDAQVIASAARDMQ